MKKILIFGAQRTGTTLAHSLVSAYMRNKYSPFAELGEPFNLRIPFQTFDPITDTERKIDQYCDRFKEFILTFNNVSTVMKIHGTTFSELPTELQDYFKASHEVILCERDDTWETLLSWLIAFNTGNWITMEKQTAVKPFTVKKQYYTLVKTHIANYNLYKDTFPNVIGTIKYTNDLTNKFELLNNIFTDWQEVVPNPETIQLPVKSFELAEKESMISNIDTLRNWYNQDKTNDLI